MLGRQAGLWLAVVLAVHLTVPTVAAETTTLRGNVRFDSPFTIAAEDTLIVANGTIITGPGPIEVWGTLLVEGSADAAVQVSVPVLLLGNATSRIDHARFWAVNGTALTVQAGALTVNDTRFEGNARGIEPRGTARVQASNVTFHAQKGEAIYLHERADLVLSRARFEGNQHGATVFSAARFLVEESVFVDNRQHLSIELGPWSAPGGTFALRANEIRASGATPAAAIELRHAGGEPRVVTLADDRIEGAAIGLRAEGRDLRVRSTNDTLVGNAVGLSYQFAAVEMVGTTFGNQKDVDGSGELVLRDVTYLRPTGAATTSAPAGRAWLPWLVVGGLVLALGAALVAPRVARRAAPPPPIRVPVQAADPEPEPELPVGPISPLERRILEDIAANPGTPQRAVADRLGYTRQALHYHVKKLEARGLVTKRSEGRETRCTVSAAGLAQLSATQVTKTRSEEKG